MSAEMNAPERLFSWVDVDVYLSKLELDQKWPEWLNEVDAFWDGLEISVSQSTTSSEVSRWLSEVFRSEQVDVSEHNLAVLLDNGLDGSESKPLPIRIRHESPGLWRPEPRWHQRRTVRSSLAAASLPSENFENSVEIIGMHSFKGGVGRTLHCVALASELSKVSKVLLIDGDIEAPGITSMLHNEGLRLDFSFLDLLALMQGADEDNWLRIARGYLANQRIGDVIFLPARRDPAAAFGPRIDPADVNTPNRSEYFLTESIAKLAGSLGAAYAVVDLRAGHSELSAPVLLDPRVRRILVTTDSAQSIEGTVLTARELSKRTPIECNSSRSENCPFPPTSAIVTLVRRTDTTEAIADRIRPIRDAFAAQSSLLFKGDDSTFDEAAIDVSSAPLISFFNENLLALPGSWSEVLVAISNCGVADVLRPLVEELSHPKGSSLEVDAASEKEENFPDLQDRRKKLAQFADTLSYGESVREQDFLATTSLKNLVEANRTRLPLCLATGSKGSGKTFTLLQMCYRRSWANYAKALSIDDVEIDATLVPALVSKNLGDEVRGLVEEIQSAVAGGEGPSTTDIRDLVSDALSRNLNDRGWRSVWLNILALSLGLESTEENAENLLRSYSKAERFVFLLDGLEDLLPEIVSDINQQRALRVLVTDCVDWLRSLRGGLFGLVVFVRVDLVRSALSQNSAQLLNLYRKYELRWDSLEAMRLALWVAVKSGAVDADDYAEASYDRVTELMTPVWGEKMGGPRSREAVSHRWFIAALSDFSGLVQPRDIVSFIAASSKGSIPDDRWSGRLLVPQAMRDALLVCSSRKISEIGEESPRIGEILGRLKSLETDLKQVPFKQDVVDLSIDDIALLESNGVVFREEDQYWIPEIYRHGLGFRVAGRPRILAVANLVRRRNGLAQDG